MKKEKIGRQISQQIKRIGLKKFHVAAFSEISRTQLDKILQSSNDYTIDTLLKVLKAIDLDIELISQHEKPEPVKKEINKWEDEWS